MTALGIALLGNLNKPAFSQQTLGAPCWRIVLSAGTVVFILGVLNILAVRLPTSCPNPSSAS